MEKEFVSEIKSSHTLEIPQEVIDRLSLNYDDKVVFIEKDGKVYMEKA